MQGTYITPLNYYLKYLNSKPKDLQHPKIHEVIELPKSRSIHFNMFNRFEEENYESFSFLNTILRDRIYFRNVEKLHNPKGKIRITTRKLTSYNQELRKKFEKARIVEDDDKLAITNRDLLVYNYKTIYVNNIYQVQPMLNYHIAKNALETLVHTINQGGDFPYIAILFDLPVNYPKLSKMANDANKPMDITLAKRYPEFSAIVLLELWNMMFLDRDSVFKRIDESKRQNIFLYFVNNNKYTAYKLTDLMSMSKELKVDGKYPRKSNTEAAKILMASLFLFKTNTTIPEETLKGIEANIEKNAIDITSMSDSELEEYLREMGLKDEDEIEEEVDETPEKTGVDSTPKPQIPSFKKEIKTYEDVKENLNIQIDKAVNKKTLSKAESTRLIEVIESQPKKEFVVNDKKTTLGELLSYENVDTTNRNIPLPDNKTVLDKEMLSNLNVNLDKQYMEKMYYKDIFNSIYSMQNGKVVVLDHKIDKKKTFMGETEVHEITIKPIDGGSPTTIKQILPVINPETGTYKISGNEYILRFQRKDLPIRKTSPTEVLLSSYAGKLFIEKNVLEKNNPSKWLGKKLASDDRFTNIIMKRNKPYGVELLPDYTIFGSILNRFTFNSIVFTFDYNNRLGMLMDSDLTETVKKLEIKEKMTFIGMKGKTLYYLKNDRTIVAGSDELKEVSSDIFTFLDIDINQAPTEFAVINILNKTLPLGLVLIYYMGFDTLLSILGIKQRYYPKEEKYKLLPSEYSIELKNGKLVFDKNDRKATIILSGIPATISKGLSLSDLNNKDVISSVFNLMEMSIAHSTHIDSIEDTFLDNITKDTLKLMKEPTDIHELLIRAAELLSDDNYKNPNNISDNNIVRYERIAGMMYKTLSNAIKTYNTKNVLSKARITVDPYEVWKMIGDDSTSMLVTNNNPIDTIKQRDNVTYLGEFGRSKITMTVPSRIMTPEEVGIISEATPDSGDSGISTYLTHSANISNIRGMVEPIDMKNYSINKALSTANILHPFITNDDSKRSNFASIHASHVIPMLVMKPTRVWSGAESTIAHKVGAPFVYTATHYGEVIEMNKTSIKIKFYIPIKDNNILLEYNEKNSIRAKKVYNALIAKGYNVIFSSDNYLYRVYVGDVVVKDKGVVTVNSDDIKASLSGIKKADTKTEIKSYSLKPWASKVEASQSIKHMMTTILTKDSVVYPDDVITYDAGFFEPNIYDPTSIIVKMGNMFKVAFLEKKTTYEDSVEINRKILKKTGENKYKILSKVIDTNSHITNVLTEGTEVKYGDKLMSIIDSALLLDDTLSEKSKMILSEASDSSPKANANGIIDRIDVIYNCELEEMDASIRALADISNRRFKEENGTDGRVTNEYSISGIPLMENQIELKYYISYQADTKIGDKFTLVHQLKTTVGAVLEDVVTEDGDQVDYVFSNKSVLARITNSGYTLGIIGNMMEEITKRAVKAFKQ